METTEKINRLYEKVCNKPKSEGYISDYVLYNMIKQFFNAPNLTFYDFGIIKQTIERMIKR